MRVGYRRCALFIEAGWVAAAVERDFFVGWGLKGGGDRVKRLIAAIKIDCNV